MVTKIHSKTVLSLILTIVFIGLILGCAAKKQFWGDEVTGFIVSYRLAPNQAWTYHSSSSQDMTMEQMGQPIEIVTNTFSGYTITGKGVNKQKHLIASFAIDSMNIVAKMMGRENSADTEPAIGKSFGLTFTPKGKELGLEGADTIQIDIAVPGAGKQSVESMFRNLLPNLPDKPIKIGESWVENDTMSMKQSGMDINTIIQSTHTLEAIIIIDGMECLKFATTYKGTLDGEGEQMGASMNFEGDLEGKGTWYFAYKQGMFVKSNTANFMEGTIAVSGAATMTIPMSQETKSEVRLVLQPGK